MDTVVRLLEETLAHLCDSLLVLSDLLGDSDEHAQFWRQIDVLALLLNFKQGLLEALDFLVVLLFEIKHHRYCGSSVTLLKLARIRTHVESDVADLIGLMMAVTRHNDGTFEFVDDGLVDLGVLRLLVGEARALGIETLNLFVNQLEAIIDGKIFRDIVNN